MGTTVQCITIVLHNFEHGIQMASETCQEVGPLTSSSPHIFQFLALPAELRDRIYEYAVSWPSFSELKRPENLKESFCKQGCSGCEDPTVWVWPPCGCWTSVRADHMVWSPKGFLFSNSRSLGCTLTS